MLSNIRMGTRFLLILMIAIHVGCFLFIDPRIGSYLYFIPSKICKGEIWRLFTAQFLHSGILHLAMNMLSFVQLGESLENRIGTLSFFYHIFIFGLLSSLLHVAIAFFMYFGGKPSEFYQPSLGFSGVLFTLIVIDNSLSGSNQRSLFGLFIIPSWMYPFALLFILQILLSNVSFVGHLSGLIVGYLYYYGFLKQLSPSSSTFNKLEKKICPTCCTSRIGYLPAENTLNTDNTTFRPYAVFRHTFGNYDNPDDTPHDPSLFRGQGRTLGDTITTQTPAPQSDQQRKNALDDIQDDQNIDVPQESWESA